jgi:integrase
MTLANKPIHGQATLYLEWCEYVKRQTPSTILTKRKALERFIAVSPWLEDFGKLTNYEFDEWRATLAKEGRTGKTINGYADCVTGCVKWLKTHRKLQVALDFDLIERAEEDDTEVSYYTPEEIAKALTYCRGPRDQLLLSLGYQSGLRLTEIATLKVENIEGLAVKVIGKKRKRRRTFIREDTREKLDKWCRLNDIYKGYIFPSPIKFETYLSPQSIRECIHAIFQLAGIKKRNSPHDLRHTWFTTMLGNGAPLMDTAIMGGHSDPRVTARYYHVSPERHAAIHQEFIPAADELMKQKRKNNSAPPPQKIRPQEFY